MDHMQPARLCNHQPGNPQAGASDIPDAAEISSSVPVGLRSRNNRDGLGVDDRLPQEWSMRHLQLAESARSRAFLDYEGKGDL